MKKRFLILPVLGVLALGSASALVLNNASVVETRAEDAATVIDPGITNLEKYTSVEAHLYFTTNPFTVAGHTFAYIKVNGVQRWSEPLENVNFCNVWIGPDDEASYTFEWVSKAGLTYARGMYPQGDNVTINETLTVKAGAQKALTVSATGAVTYQSSDTSIATVDANGVVTGVAEGTATITATCGEASDTCLVTVTPAGVIDTYSIASMSNWHGDQFAQANWSDSSFKLDGDAYVKYDVTDGTHTKVGANSKNNWAGGSIFMVGPDIYNARASVTYLLFTFYDNNNDVVFYAQFGNPPSADTIAFASNTAEVTAGNSIQLTAITEAESVTWTSSDNSIATVSGSGTTGTVTGVAAGEVTITATLANSASASVTVTVFAAPVKLDAPTGVVMNAIADGGYICAFGGNEHATGYTAQYYNAGTSTLVGSHDIANGGALNPTAADLVAGNSYNVKIVAKGNGTSYLDSDPSAVATVVAGKRKDANTFVYHTGESYANYFLGLAMCSDNGATMKVTEALWADATNMYENVFYAERQNLKNKTTTAATNAIARYVYILGKYSESDYSYLKDFLSLGEAAPRPVSTSIFNIFGNNNNDNTLTVVAISVSLVAAASILGVVIIKKRHFAK